MRKDIRLRRKQEKGQIVSFHPTGEYYFHRGITAYHRRELAKAKRYLERARELEPLEPTISTQLAILYTELGFFEKSNELLLEVMDDLDPYMKECLYFIANNYAHLGWFREAYQYATRYLTVEPTGEFAEDAEDLIELVEMDAGDLLGDEEEEDELIYKQEQARQLIADGKYDEAIALLNEVIQEHPEFWSAYNNLSLAFFHSGQIQKSFEILDEVLDKNPGNLHARCNLAVLFYYEGKKDEVDAVLRGLRIVRPILQEHRYKLGATFALLGYYEDAYKWLKLLARKGYEGDGAFYYWLSITSHQLGFTREAEYYWKKVVEQDPEKAGEEPWLMDNIQIHEEDPYYIMALVTSEDTVEIMYGLFLLSQLSSQEKRKLILENAPVQQLPMMEKAYLAYILKRDPAAEEQEDLLPMFTFVHDTAILLSQELFGEDKEYKPVILMWFSVFLRGVASGHTFKNEKAYASALQVVWHQLSGQKTTIKEWATLYGVSPSTVSKYCKVIKELLS
ncbi:tetratricopeptide repeat protein [Mangrovibacillus cuniculi]|uniref:Tetratricopeptide repeat protein n=1 Tax=Mangrovibacillus cuniculi TaxID=2593652 RepID=A0A7S8CCW0_9BACI|nr:tetratricopeptide repeat protein [Mangrovibacillus cuniculi]QPC47458.1 tetratricopeptide repeat protein [Mangrovibacillus cuniculi]